MSAGEAIGLYSKLFDRNVPKDEEFYHSLYVTPIHTDSLISILSVNSESISSGQFSGPTAAVLQELLQHGVRYLMDAMNCPLAEDGLEFLSESTTLNGFTSVSANGSNGANGANGASGANGTNGSIGSSTRSTKISMTHKFEDGEDITALDAPDIVVTLPTTAVTSLVDLNEEEDITQLNGQTTTTRRRSSVASLGSNGGSGGGSGGGACNSRTSFGGQSLPKSFNSRRFVDLDDILRIELVINILKILKTWFITLVSSNDMLKRAKSTIGIDSSEDLCISVLEYLTAGKLQQQSFGLSTFANLLYSIKWYMGVHTDDSLHFPVINELIHLMHSMLRMIYKTLLANPDNQIIQVLLSTFYNVDCAPELERILLQLPMEPNQPSLLDYTSTIELFSIIGTLVKVPGTYLSKLSVSSDITSLITSLNNYETHFGSLVFFKRGVKHQLADKIIPFLAFDFKIMYKQRPDLVRSEISGASFIGWFADTVLGSTSLYLKFETADYITTLANQSEFDPAYDFAAKINEVYVDNVAKSNNHDDTTELDLPPRTEFLQILLLMYSMVTNNEFLAFLTTKDPNQDEYHIELLDIWLSVLLYVASYRNLSMRTAVLVSGWTVLKLTSKNAILDGERVVERLSAHEINEFKWKINHQRKPVVPVTTVNGKKPALLYIIDVFQVYMRFNLTRKLDTELYSITCSIIYQILIELKTLGENVDYSWLEFYKSLFLVLRFIYKHIKPTSKHFQHEVGVLVCQLLVIVDVCLLSPGVINSDDLIFDLLLELESIGDLLVRYAVSEELVPLVYRSRKFLQDEVQKMPTVLNMEHGTNEFALFVSRFNIIEAPASLTLKHELAFPSVHKELHEELATPSSLGRVIELALDRR